MKKYYEIYKYIYFSKDIPNNLLSKHALELSKMHDNFHRAIAPQHTNDDKVHSYSVLLTSMNIFKINKIQELLLKVIIRNNPIKWILGHACLFLFKKKKY